MNNVLSSGGGKDSNDCGELKNVGKIMSMHLHSDEPNKKTNGNISELHPMKDVESMTLVSGKGILNNTRYYNTLNKKTNKPNINHVSLIEREQINNHMMSISVGKIDPGMVRSNIETTGIDLVSLIGQYISIGDTAVLYFYKARIPCWKMDVIHDGLQKLMKFKRQGVIAEIIISGNIKTGDFLRPISIEEVNVMRSSDTNSS